MSRSKLRHATCARVLRHVWDLTRAQAATMTGLSADDVLDVELARASTDLGRRYIRRLSVACARRQEQVVASQAIDEDIARAIEDWCRRTGRAQ